MPVYKKENDKFVEDTSEDNKISEDHYANLYLHQPEDEDEDDRYSKCILIDKNTNLNKVNEGDILNKVNEGDILNKHQENIRKCSLFRSLFLSKPSYVLNF